VPYFWAPFLTTRAATPKEKKKVRGKKQKGERAVLAVHLLVDSFRDWLDPEGKRKTSLRKRGGKPERKGGLASSSVASNSYGWPAQGGKKRGNQKRGKKKREKGVHREAFPFHAESQYIQPNRHTAKKREEKEVGKRGEKKKGGKVTFAVGPRAFPADLPTKEERRKVQKKKKKGGGEKTRSAAFGFAALIFYYSRGEKKKERKLQKGEKKKRLNTSPPVKVFLTLLQVVCAQKGGKEKYSLREKKGGKGGETKKEGCLRSLPTSFSSPVPRKGRKKKKRPGKRKKKKKR